MRSITKPFAIAMLAIPAAGLAADTTQLGLTVLAMEIAKPISPGNLSLKNLSSSKRASQRDLVVVGDAPRFVVTGRVTCKPGATLTAVQAIIGKPFIHNTELTSLGDWGKSVKLTHVAGAAAANVEIPVTLKLTRRSGDALVDLTFNPAREYERHLKAYVAKGNTASEYLHETQAFDMEVTVNLVAWCRMNAAGKVASGKTYPGIVSRTVPVTILYNGDPAIFEGPAARTKTSVRKASGAPPAKTDGPAQ